MDHKGLKGQAGLDPNVQLRAGTDPGSGLIFMIRGQLRREIFSAAAVNHAQALMKRGDGFIVMQ